MAKKSKTATNIRKHEVKASLANFELAKEGSSLKLRIYANDKQIGKLEIGRGSLYWSRRQRGKRISWSHFALMMDKLAKIRHPSGSSDDDLDMEEMMLPALPTPKKAKKKAKRGA